MVDHHQELLVQVGVGDGAQGPGPRGHLVSLDPVPVPMAHEHGVDVVDEVGDGELGVGGCQPVPAEVETEPW